MKTPVRPIVIYYWLLFCSAVLVFAISMFAYGEEDANYQEWRQQPMPKEYKYEAFQDGLAIFPYLFLAFFATCVVWAVISALTLAAWWLTRRFSLPSLHQPSLPGERGDYGGRAAVEDNPYRPPG